MSQSTDTRFSRIKVGEIAELSHRITADDLARFAELSGDRNRLHLDPDYAARTPLKAPVAHGMLGAAFISAVIGNRLPGDGALWFAQSLEFLLPVRVGDTLTVRAEVLAKDERQHVVELATDVFNQHRQKVTTGVAKVKVMEQEPLQARPVVRVPRTALIVGATGGIGRAICTQLAADGFALALHYRSDRAAAERLRDGLLGGGSRAHLVAGDITDAASVRELVSVADSLLGGIGVLVNCASAQVASQPFAVLDWSDFARHLDVSVGGAFSLARAVVPIMEQQGGGRIIHLTSQAVETPNGEWLPYITAKAALNGFSRSLAVELAPRGIRVNLVSPGMTDTEMIADIPEKARLLVAARTPLKRLARPEDVAGAVSFLASDRADFLTGETIRVNGGQVML